MINSEIELLKLNKNYGLASLILEDILDGRCPDVNLLESLYGSKKSKMMFTLIREFLVTSNFHNRIKRGNNLNAPMEITLARREIENDLNYQKIHSAILLDKVPAINQLEVFYGGYSKQVKRIIELYAEKNLRRKCEISAASHLNRVGACVFQLKMNDTGKYNYSAAAIMHDSIEDLLKLSTNNSGKGIDSGKYHEFIIEYVPDDLQQKVKILTNHYDLIVSFIKEKLIDEDKALTKKNILQELEIIAQENPGELLTYVTKMIDLLNKSEVEEHDLEGIKWEFYINLYLEGIANATMKEKDHRIYEIKGVDLADNSHGKGALSVDARIRNIKKNLMWGIKGYGMHSTWKPFNDHIEELVQDALLSAQLIVLSDLMKPDSSLDFMMSTLLKIEKLENVFFVN